jgi:hypothetical protein
MTYGFLREPDVRPYSMLEPSIIAALVTALPGPRVISL